MSPCKPHFSISEEDALEIGVEAWTYLLPLILMEFTRRVMTNVETPDSITLRAPIGSFSHASRFPDATFKDMVRPNADTLYSMLWYDVETEPLILTAPDSPDRYHVLPLMDMWTDVFACVGTQSTGGTGGRFAIIGRDWQGNLPADVRVIRSPTAYGWILGRIQANGPSDFESLRAIQGQIQAAPLSGRQTRPTIDPAVDMKTPPVDQAMELPAQEFFALAANLMKRSPPHASDCAMVFRLARIGFVPGEPFDLSKAPLVIRQALQLAASEAKKRMLERGMARRLHRDGWVLPAVLGVYGNEYRSRALTAYRGLGALPPTEALYSSALADGQGQPLHGRNRYRLHFPNGQIPPARAFWSLTIYGADQFFVANPIDRFAIGDRDALKLGADGALDLYLQHESPGPALKSNWLPTPAGLFSMTLRLYVPRPEALDGRWYAPPIERLT